MPNTTKNIDYTQIPNLRVIKNRDFKTVAGQRSTMNIGLGTPSYAQAELPANNISKNGDMAFIEELDGMGYYSESQEAWILIGSEPTAAPSFAGFQLTVVGNGTYPNGIPQALAMDTIEVTEAGGDYLGVGLGTNSIVNESGDKNVTALFSFDCSLATIDGEGASATLFFFKNGLDQANGNPAYILFAFADKRFSASISAMITLVPGDYIQVWLEAESGGNINVETSSANMNVVQLRAVPA